MEELESLLAEIAKADAIHKETGRRDWKRLSVIYKTMAIQSLENTQESQRQFNLIVEAFDELHRQYESVAASAVRLEAANFELYHILQSEKFETIGYRC